MKKILKIVIVLVIFVLLIIDFVGLWKYKLSGKKYETATSTENDAVVEELPKEDPINYIELDSTTMNSDEVLFIKNIESKDGKYTVQGIIYTPYEISKDDYTTLRSGESVEILGKTYTKGQIKSNNLVLKASDDNTTDYYVNYNTKTKKYILKENKTDNIVYATTSQYAKVTVEEGTAFSVIENGKTQNKKIEDVIDTHKEQEDPKEETANLNTCVLTFDKNGNCTKIVETCR